MKHSCHAVGGFAKGHDTRRVGKRMRYFPGRERAAFELQLRQHGVAHIDGRHGLMENLLRQLLAVGIVRLHHRRGLSRGGHCAILASASTPACATTTSSASGPPLTPMPPTHWPPTISGRPPRRHVSLASEASAKPREFMGLGSSAGDGPVGARRRAALRALVKATSTEESLAPAMRAKTSRWAPSSTMAMFCGTLISRALASATPRMVHAPSSVRRMLLRVSMHPLLGSRQGNAREFGVYPRECSATTNSLEAGAFGGGEGISQHLCRTHRFGIRNGRSGTIRFGLCGGLRSLSTSAACPFCRRCSPTPPTG